MAEWNESEHPRDKDGKFTDGAENGKNKMWWALSKTTEELRKLLMIRNLPESYSLPDEELPKSVGAKWANHDIAMPDGSIAHFANGAILQNKEVFAGKGCKRQIDCVERLLEQYPGSVESEWTKCKAHSIIIVKNEEIEAEVHWYEEKSVGKVEFKAKL